MNSKSTVNKDICPVCSFADIEVFVEIPQVPIHCNILWSTRNEARKAPKGDIRLGFCKACGHIFNILFEPDSMKYSKDYENSLHFSSRFQDYARSLATRLVKRYELYNKDIIEIGCGKGDFLKLLCELGRNRGIGFDPSYEHERIRSDSKEQITFIQDFYSEHYANYKADFICCRQFLEHIQYPRDFLINLRHTIGSHNGTIVFFELPNVMFTIKDLGIWDIIYEHSGYFSISSLAHVFSSSGFEVSNVSESFEGQFLCIEAMPIDGLTNLKCDNSDDLKRIAQDVDAFAYNYRYKVESWQRKLEKIEKITERAVVWGAGSKGVTFLNTLEVQDQIKYVIDINPHKQGKHVSGTGQKIMPPAFIQEYKPHIIIVMNPIYVNEIRQATKNMNISPELITV